MRTANENRRTNFEPYNTERIRCHVEMTSLLEKEKEDKEENKENENEKKLLKGKGPNPKKN